MQNFGILFLQNLIIKKCTHFIEPSICLISLKMRNETHTLADSGHRQSFMKSFFVEIVTGLKPKSLIISARSSVFDF